MTESVKAFLRWLESEGYEIRQAVRFHEDGSMEYDNNADPVNINRLLKDYERSLADPCDAYVLARVRREAIDIDAALAMLRPSLDKIHSIQVGSVQVIFSGERPCIVVNEGTVYSLAPFSKESEDEVSREATDQEKPSSSSKTSVDQKAE